MEAKTSSGSKSNPEGLTETMEYEAATTSSFESLKGSISEGTMKAINEMEFKYMTEIQAKSIPKLLKGIDLRGTAKTGSGKTLAFLIPTVELIVRLKYELSDGAGAIIISPTRELSMQTFSVLKDLMKYHTQTYGLIMGGTNRKSEAEKLASGINILVATPGRLMDHLKNSLNFKYDKLTCLVIDEADRICSDGFQDEMKGIIRLLPKRRQTMLFSATINDQTEELSSLALKARLMEVNVDLEKSAATTGSLVQSYVICPWDKRLLLLYTFLKRSKKKVMVFFSCCLAVKFYKELFNFIDIPVLCIHGRQSQSKRTAAFNKFLDAKSGVLFCTDVAARGWDIPDVDWIIQFDPPNDPKEYIHRVGRTARAGQEGRALLFITEDEIGLLRHLKEHKVPVEQQEVNWKKVHNIQLQVEKLVSTNYYLTQSARKAFIGYVRGYQAHSMKDVYDVNRLDLNMVGKCFGLVAPPQVNISNVSLKRKKKWNGTPPNKKFLKAKRFRPNN